MKKSKVSLSIKGMHCPSCEVFIRNKFKEEKNILSVESNYQTRKADIVYSGTLNKQRLNSKISGFGYKIIDEKTAEIENEPLKKRIIDVLVTAGLLVTVYFFAKEFNLIPEFNFSSKLSYLTVFILGIVASTSTCMATSGALLLTVTGKLKDRSILPTLSFGAGRVLSYGFFGLVAGFIGKSIIYDFRLGSVFLLVVSILMMIVALDMLKLISFSSVFFSSSRGRLFERLENKLIVNPKKTSFFIGAITYLLPCGFTQAVQLYALGLADPLKSSLTMIIFAVGTLPVLMILGLTSSLTKSSFYPVFMRVVGVLVLIIGGYYFMNSLSLFGLNLNQAKTVTENTNVSVETGQQTVRMSVDSSGYHPNDFTIKKGLPVRWIISGDNVFGCQAYFIVPKLGIQRTLKSGENIIEFTPTETGEIPFSCSMGMYRGRFVVE